MVSKLKLYLRFVVPLALALSLVAFFLMPLVDSFTFKWFVRDLDMRSKLVANTLQKAMVDQIGLKSEASIVDSFSRAVLDERLFAVGFCNAANQLRYRTQTFPQDSHCEEFPVDEDRSFFVKKTARGPLHYGIFPVRTEKLQLGKLILVHDMSFIQRRSSDTKKYVFYLFLGLSLVISLITVVVAQLSWRGWLNGMRALLKGELLFKPLSQLPANEYQPLAKELRALIKDLDSDRRFRDEGRGAWTPGVLKQILNEQLYGEEVIIVSNRQPYLHIYKNDKIEVQIPASGLVTALEPVMRACSGTWVAHGSGSADKAVVDEHDRVTVPPQDPSYQIRRVWLSKEEEQGYYYGFSNEGLWPLCHMAHTRPVFRSDDWKQYHDVNQKFAQAVIEEAKTEDPVILVQDYHFALLPKMVREELPKATIISFWHIPWPNPEAFGICPWREEILEGLLGSSILGFHTQFHCNNFIETVDRYLEARIDRETSTISFGGKACAIKNYPISIEWPRSSKSPTSPIEECQKKIRELNHLRPEIKIGLGVDRLDYTKGIVERFLAVERFLELQPEWQGKFTFIQIAAPSRSSISQYQDFERAVREHADRINHRFKTVTGCPPIILKVEHHNPDQVFEYYRAVDFCMVTSLHDGMNLVAKEFVAARTDEQGVLILSQFTGASRELPESLLVNPYNIDQCAYAIHLGLTMPPKEQRDRMRSMRGLIQEFNVYRWAGRMLLDAARMRKRMRLFRRIKGSETYLQDGVWEK